MDQLEFETNEGLELVKITQVHLDTLLIKLDQMHAFVNQSNALIKAMEAAEPLFESLVSFVTLEHQELAEW